MKLTMGLVIALTALLFVSFIGADTPCQECYKALQAKVAACQRNLPAPKKNPTKDEQAARTRAERECNNIAIEGNKGCKGVCGIK